MDQNDRLGLMLPSQVAKRDHRRDLGAKCVNFVLAVWISRVLIHKEVPQLKLRIRTGEVRSEGMTGKEEALGCGCRRCYPEIMHITAYLISVSCFLHLVFPMYHESLMLN